MPLGFAVTPRRFHGCADDYPSRPSPRILDGSGIPGPLTAPRSYPMSLSWHRRSLKQQRKLAATRRYRPLVEHLESREMLSGSPLGTELAPAAYGQLPLTFERNDGQTHADVRFL